MAVYFQTNPNSYISETMSSPQISLLLSGPPFNYHVTLIVLPPGVLQFAISNRISWYKHGDCQIELGIEDMKVETEVVTSEETVRRHFLFLKKEKKIVNIKPLIGDVSKKSQLCLSTCYRT